MTEQIVRIYEPKIIDKSTLSLTTSFQRIQVTPRRVTNEQHFNKLETFERQHLVEKLIKKVKAL